MKVHLYRRYLYHFIMYLWRL